MKLCICFLLLLTGKIVHAQSIVIPAAEGLDQKYFKNRTVFHKLTWIDPKGNVTREATLKLVSRIDSVNRKFIYLQTRNDGKRDSTICELGSLKPIYTASYSGNQNSIYQYSSAGYVIYKTEKSNTLVSEEKYALTNPHFDGFISEYLLGALPLKVGYSAKFETFRPDLKRNSETFIENTFVDVVTVGSKATSFYVLSMKSEGLKYLVWIDKQTKQIIRTIFSLPDGGTFVKQVM